MSFRMIVAAVLISLPSFLLAQSLAEIAAREKKRREALEKAGRSSQKITESDLNADRVGWEGWNKFAAREDKFSVFLPKYPDSQNNTETYNFGTVRQKVYSSTLQQTTYGVVVSDYPDAAKGTLPALLFDELDRGMGRQLGARLRNKNETKLGAYPGRMSTFTKPGALVETRYFLSKDRMFLLMVMAPSKDQINASFFESFQILE